MGYYSGPLFLNRGLFCSPRGHLEVSGDTSGCHTLEGKRVLLVSNGSRPEML